MIKLGYKASAEQFAPGKLLDFSCLAEDVGFDSVFVSDHFQPWKHIDGHAPFSLTWLGALGARTKRAVRIEGTWPGSAVLDKGRSQVRKIREIPDHGIEMSVSGEIPGMPAFVKNAVLQFNGTGFVSLPFEER